MKLSLLLPSNFWGSTFLHTIPFHYWTKIKSMFESYLPTLEIAVSSTRPPPTPQINPAVAFTLQLTGNFFFFFSLHCSPPLNDFSSDLMCTTCSSFLIPHSHPVSEISEAFWPMMQTSDKHPQSSPGLGSLFLSSWSTKILLFVLSASHNSY